MRPARVHTSPEATSPRSDVVVLCTFALVAPLTLPELNRFLAALPASTHRVSGTVELVDDAARPYGLERYASGICSLRRTGLRRGHCQLTVLARGTGTRGQIRAAGHALSSGRAPA